jgi:hypothetical protein
MAKQTYVVLNDGDTFSPLPGCLLVTVDDEKLSPESREALDNGNMAQFLSEEMFPCAPTMDVSGIEVHDLVDILETLIETASPDDVQEVGGKPLMDAIQRARAIVEGNRTTE